MVNEEKYLLVAESIAPEIFKKVLEAKKYIATGKAANSSEAVRLPTSRAVPFINTRTA